MDTPKWIEFVNNFPKRSSQYWMFDLIPSVTVAGDEEGPLIGFGWLFWAVLIYFPKWE